MPYDRSDEPSAARVLSTGIALVHEGELVLPAAGSEAQATLAAADDRTSIAYLFPVEIEVRSVGASVDVRAALDDAFRMFADQVHNH